MPELQAAWDFLENSDLVADAGEVQAAIERLAAQITRELSGAYPLVLVVMGGAVVFAGQLLPQAALPDGFRLRACHALRRRDQPAAASTGR